MKENQLWECYEWSGKRGDDRVQWNEQDALAGDAQANAAIREAEHIAGTWACQRCNGFSRRSRQASRATGAVWLAGRADNPGATGDWWVIVEMLDYFLLGIIVIIAALGLGLLGWLAYNRYLKWLEPRRRANVLLRSVLTRAQYRQLMWHCYVDIKSLRDPERIYRVPRYPGRVGMIEQGRRKADLCLGPLDWVPDADLVVIHKLMIEADEEIYLQTANRFPPKYIGDWEDWAISGFTQPHYEKLKKEEKSNSGAFLILPHAITKNPLSFLPLWSRFSRFLWFSPFMFCLRTTPSSPSRFVTEDHQDQGWWSLIQSSRFWTNMM
jgi:hypothetical protein